MQILAAARRAWRKPPRELARRLIQELGAQREQLLGPRRARRFDDRALLRATGAVSIDALWERLEKRPYPAVTRADDARAIGDRERIAAAAENARARRVDLLGSGPHELGQPIDWHTDFTVGQGWPLKRSRTIDYVNLERPSDVKIPWELSRLHWLLPLGQEYLLTGDDAAAQSARDVLAQWIDANPYAIGPNWIVAMEPAMRIVSWTWLFHAFAASDAWSDTRFRSSFLRMLFLHADFVERNIERSDVNGNHYTADATGLVFAGLFFGDGERPRLWSRNGWAILHEELPKQVTPDGVDFEMATAYHRLVAECFILAGRYRDVAGIEVEPGDRERMAAMTEFAAAYTRPDGSSPLWGDADDARLLPLGGTPLTDHRYLAGLLGLPFTGPDTEVAWILGHDAARSIERAPEPRSRLFPDAGIAIMRGDGDHVFVDCGPVGLAGRGGHGHNDCLSLEVMLDGVLLVSDSGSYVYTASPAWRNRFRSTAFHSTPRIDGQEQNRFVPGSLWLLEDDARPTVLEWDEGEGIDRFSGAHSGYERLPAPVRVIRRVELDRRSHTLALTDSFEGTGAHQVQTPLQLAVGTSANVVGPGEVVLESAGRLFDLRWSAADAWTLELSDGWVSPSYGVKLPAPRLEWSRTGSCEPLTLTIRPRPA